MLRFSKKIPQKPKPKFILENYPLLKNSNLYKIDFAKSQKFTEEIKKLKRITINYRLPKDSDYKKEEIIRSTWHKELEKSLIRMGFIVNNSDDSEELILLDEKKETNPPDATLLIDRVELKIIKSNQNISLEKLKSHNAKYSYNYYLAEINGKIILQNNDIIWSCNIVASSFDLLKYTQKLKPEIYVGGKRDYRYSEKLNNWISNKWHLEYHDNFQKHYADQINNDFHKRELVNYVIKSFSKTITTR